METVVIPSSVTPFITYSPKRERTAIKPETERILDAYFISLTKQIEAGLKPSISFEKVEEALASGSVSPDVIDDMEDAMFGQIMVEDLDDDEYVSEEEVMEILSA